MILDSQQQFAAAQVLAASGVSTNIIDFTVDRNVGIGVPMSVLILVSAIDATSADETYKVQVQASVDAAFTVPLVVGGLVDIPRAVAVPAKVVIPIPADLASDRFLRLSWTLGGTTPSITYTAYLVPQSFIQNNVLYDVGTRIS